MNLSVAKVVVDLSLDREFDYRIPTEMQSQVSIGSVVSVPFGRGTTRRGYVVGMAETSTFPALKNIESVTGDKPLLDESLIELAKWMADYYAAPFEHAVRTMLPGAVRRANARHKELLSIHLLPAGAHAEVIREVQKRAPLQATLLKYLKKESGGFLAEVAKKAGVTSSVCPRSGEKRLCEDWLGNKTPRPSGWPPFSPHPASCNERGAGGRHGGY